MLQWIEQNLGTIAITAVLIVIVTSILVHEIRRKKRGKSSCGCSCGSCPMKNSCHSNSCSAK